MGKGPASAAKTALQPALNSELLQGSAAVSMPFTRGLASSMGLNAIAAESNGYMRLPIGLKEQREKDEVNVRYRSFGMVPVVFPRNAVAETTRLSSLRFRGYLFVVSASQNVF
jgi:hypothetical protein